MGYLAADRDDATGDGGDLGSVGQCDSAFGFPFGLVLEYQNSRSDRFDVLKRCALFGHGTFRAQLWEVVKKEKLETQGSQTLRTQVRAD